MNPRCGYCAGMRTPCTCEDDCGARGTPAAGHCCPKAPGPVYRNWLRSTGLYPDLGPAEEIPERQQ